MTDSVDVRRQLDDLPDTFTRQTTPNYVQLMDSFEAGMRAFTDGSDGTLGQVFQDAQFGWLDVWAAIFGILRFANEGDAVFQVRITETLLAWVGTVPAIQAWGQITLNLAVQVTENANGLGYVITFPGTLTTAQINAFLMSLTRIRPIGVPFVIVQQQIGLYLDTINYFDDGDVVGDYLTDDGTPTLPVIAPLINSTVPLLPEYFFNDPTLNPGLAS